jgi:hypothetical protein
MNQRSTVIPLGMLLSAGLALTWPSVGSAASCTISPQNPTINQGGSIAWSATYSGFTRTPSYSWTFGGGNPASSTSRTPTVSYPTAGKFNTSLRLSYRGTTASCSTSATVSAPDKTPPTVSISSSPSGSFVAPKNVIITGAASDNVGVTKVEFYDGTTLKATDTSAPYSYAWSATEADKGNHAWTAWAYDAANNVGKSDVLTLTVKVPLPAPNVSINSTSQNSLDVAEDPYSAGAVDEAPRPNNANSLSPAAGTGSSGYQLLAINDLGMHCGDLDARISSILPPFQVLLSQVVQKGGEPKILGPNDGIEVVYSAASNPSDPILTKPKDPATGYPFTGLTSNYDVYKTNFWDIAFQAYNPFYPPGILELFYDPNDPTNNVDVGLPVPNVEKLYIGADGRVKSGDEALAAVQHAMPGIASPYLANDAKMAEEHYGNKPFFIDFPFGYVANGVNWFEGAGVPFAAFDDFGRENPYPLVRVQAKSGSTVLASVDTVLPISGEANCQGCHAAVQDGGNGAGIRNLKTGVMVSIDDPLEGKVPAAVSVEWASDLNILALHDQKHGTKLRSTVDAKTGRAAEPVVCQRCHYTPALDLAQVGPNDVNGRDQLKQKSMSNVMHSHHATVTDANGGVLFPSMPAPTADNATTGLPGNQPDRLTKLDQTCYQCHPGKNTKCMRGAMADGGMVCQDCHGQMAQIGNDFSKYVSPANAGDFRLAKDFYTNPATLRVPWANEPGCGSCHTGDATSNLAGSTGALANGYDTNGVADGIRLIRAYLSTDTNAKPIVPANKRFAENTVPSSFNGFANPGVGNPKLYRVSTGHGGVMCEGCHGATHAEWDTDGSTLLNDNVTANQLQGHSGTISECSTCHVTTSVSSNTQEGPHGMHLVNDSRFWRESHKDMAKTENGKPNGGSCGACHGADHKGTVLSRAPVNRTFSVESTNRTVLAGQPLACNLCHSLDKSFAR